MIPSDFLSLCTALGLVTLLSIPENLRDYPPTRKEDRSEVMHGLTIRDPFRWLESGSSDEVKNWVAEQEKLTRAYLDNLPQRKALQERLELLWRYDDETPPMEVLASSRQFFWLKKHDAEKRIYCTRADSDGETLILIDPNQWKDEETVDSVTPSLDGSLLAFGKAQGGDERPVVQVMEVPSKKILPDRLHGLRQNVNAWLPDGSGFFYTAHPEKGEVPDGEEFYWHSVYFHKLGDTPDKDKRVFYHDSVKEYYHGAQITEDGTYLILYRWEFDKNEVFFRKLDSKEPPIPLAVGFDASYAVDEHDGTFFIRTDWDAPKGRVMAVSANSPFRKNWKEIIPESADTLESCQLIGGYLYATYMHDASTRIKIFKLDGSPVKELSLPGIGSAGVWGYMSKPPVWVAYESYNQPDTTYTYDLKKDHLTLVHRSPVKMDLSAYITEQVWVTSKDGTRLPMFVVRPKSMKKKARYPTLLTGYGGFNIPQTPSFSTIYGVWLEAGGILAVPCLRGGGEYGREWHESGMLDRKQNVFDDFIASAEWLINHHYTDSRHLTIMGGSNGGLLVGAAAVQRPDLFAAVLCQVPLLDMVRYHTFGLANIWAVEYGSCEDPKQCGYLYRYSPYHNVKKGVKYPPMLITGSENDARTNPLHARKMVAMLQSTDPEGGPFYLLQEKASGHGGGTTLSKLASQWSDNISFLMAGSGMKFPQETKTSPDKR
ncbi:MAG TPA: prolyl oligopeptidase family serine peptidase [Thermoanaerobaculia bacterium]|nr:prolyl oligopeptidase family serine peptidase [Thermoanaerobaculia bacterium]HUM30129.1 prolyl oligopeptidase family serine peptidase [Thermoanaerobaculia bacterium]HXK68826.1 prolyl oligopeptidase family serine peptidase [Thermoanaerobaculia bacterium]